MLNNNNRPGFVNPMPLNKKGFINKSGNTSPQLRPEVASKDITVRGSNRPKTDMSLSNRRSSRKTKEKQLSDRKYTPPTLIVDLPSSSSSDDDFTKPVERQHFYDDSKQDPVSLKGSIQPPFHVNELRLPSNGSPLSQLDFDSRLHVNIANYSSGIIGAHNEDYLKTVYSRYTRDVLSKVKSKIVDVWTFDNFKVAIGVVAEALELFYTTDSILSYKGRDGVKDNNRAMLKWQEEIDEFDILNKQNLMRKTIRGTWFPPVFSNLVRWSYQNYKFSDVEQSGNFRWIPSNNYISPNTATGPIDLTNLKADYDSVLSRLNEDTNAKIYSILSDVYPNGRINGLPKSCHYAVYDEVAVEIFANQPKVVRHNEGSYNLIYPLSNDGDITDIPYQIATDVSSNRGIGFALQTIYSGNKNTGAANSVAYGLFRTSNFGDNILVNEQRSNKFSVISDGNIISFSPRSYPQFSFQCPDMHHFHREGTNVYKQLSTVASGWQRVYFNNITAPEILGRDFFDMIFGT